MKKITVKKLMAVVMAACVVIGSGYGTRAMAAVPDNGGGIVAAAESAAADFSVPGMTDFLKDAEPVATATAGGGLLMKAETYSVPVISNNSGQAGTIPFEGESGSSISLQLQAGLFYGIFNINQATDSMVTAALQDANGSKLGDASVYRGNVAPSSALRIYIATPGTYTLSVMGSFTGTIAGQLICATYPSPSEMSIGFSTTSVNYNYCPDNNAKYYRVDCPQAGLLEIQAHEEYVSSTSTTWPPSGAKINLCNSGKTPLLSMDSYTTSGSNYVKSYFVDKGTYYIRVAGSTGYLQGVTAYLNPKGSVGSNTSQANAEKLGVSKTIQRVFPLNGQADSDWYKITVSKKQKNAIVIRNYSSDSSLDCVVRRNGKKVTSLCGLIPAGQEVCMYSYSYKDGVRSISDWKKGTYTIQLSKRNTDGNGYYEISCQQLTPAVSVKSVSVGKKKMTVKWAKKSIADGYQIRYSTSSKMKNAKTINIKKNKTTSRVIKKLKKGKCYYVQIRTYKNLNGFTCYGAWSKAKKSKKIK